MKVRKGDDVVVLAGKDVGRRGTITRVINETDKVIVGEAGAMLGLTRNASYDAAKRGDNAGAYLWGTHADWDNESMPQPKIQQFNELTV